MARHVIDVAGMKIGVPSNHYFDACSNDVASSVENAIRVLEKSGAQIIEVSVPMAEHAQEMLTRHVFADMCLRNKERLDHSPEDFDSDVYRRMIRGWDFSAVDYAEAQQFKRQWQLEAGWQNDALLFAAGHVVERSMT